MRHCLRSARAEDDALQCAIYASTRTQEMALTDWSESQREAFVRMQHEAQQRHYAQHYPQSVCHLIELPGAAGLQVVGRLWLDQRADALHVLDITLLDEARGQGLGSCLLTELHSEAAARGVPLTISVEIHNPARRLYERLGFAPDGEPQGLYQRMAWPPSHQPRHQPHHASEECLS